jgi:glycerol uptake facilitator protein
MEENSFGQKLLAEVVGTGFLVFIGVGSVPATLMLLGHHQFTMAELGVIAFAFALVVIAMVYAIGHISGCHINPAVTVSLALNGKFPWKDVPAYVGAQTLGAILGALAILATLGMNAKDLGLGVASFNPDAVGYGRAIFAEAIGTGILVFTVFGVIDRRAPAGFAGIVIGFVVFAAIIVVGPVTGASINPARTVGPMLILQVFGGAVKWSQLPAYLIGEFVGGALAAWLYVALSKTRTREEIPQFPLKEATTEHHVTVAADGSGA